MSLTPSAARRQRTELELRIGAPSRDWSCPFAPAHLRYVPAVFALMQLLVRRRDFGHEIAHERLVRQRFDEHVTRGETCEARVNRLAVDAHQALLAGVGVDTREADRKRWIDVDAKPAQR